MAGYTPGEQLSDPDIVKLNTNENPYPPSPRVFEAVRAALTGDRLRKYPEPLGDTFRQTAGRVLGVDPDSILIGNGSDDILTILTRAFVPEGGLIVSPTPSYILYRTLAEIQGRTVRDGAVHAGLGPAVSVAGGRGGPDVPAEPQLAVRDGRCDRSGRRLAAEVERAAGARRGVCRFRRVERAAAARARAEPDRHADAQQVVLRWPASASASPSPTRRSVRELAKVKDSYNCDVLSLAAATAAIEDQDYLRETCERRSSPPADG